MDMSRFYEIDSKGNINWKVSADEMLIQVRKMIKENEKFSEQFVKENPLLEEIIQFIKTYITTYNLYGEDKYFIFNEGYNDFNQLYQLWVLMDHSRKRGGFYIEFHQDRNILLFTPMRKTDVKKFIVKKGFEIEKVDIYNQNAVVIRNVKDLEKCLDLLFN